MGVVGGEGVDMGEGGSVREGTGCSMSLSLSGRMFGGKYFGPMRGVEDVICWVLG